MHKHWSIKTAIEQIDSCGFECEAGPLANNIAYQWLKDAAKVGPEFWPGQGVWFEITAEIQGFKLRKWEHFYIVGCSMTSGNSNRYWVYSLSNNPPAPYHGGVVQFHGVGAAKLRLENPDEQAKATT